MRCSRTLLWAFTTVVVGLSLAVDSAGQSSESYPSFGSGDAVRFDVRVKLQGDWRRFAEEPGVERKDPFDLHRARVGLEGTFLKRFEYQIEGELRDDERPWRDVYVNARIARALQIQAGHFKIPFSLEQLTGSTKLDFVYRSLAATYLAPGRDRGVMAHGAIGGALKYQAGIFRRGGENARESEWSDPESGRTVAARVSLRPWQGRNRPPALRAVHAGLSVTQGAVPEGPYSVRGRTVPGYALFHEVMVNGTRRRLGFELEWDNGPVALSSEIIRVSDGRRGQGLADDDLPRATARGWYVGGSWRVSDRLPARLGALSIAGRVESLAFGSGHSGAATTNPRAFEILEKADRVVTAGINWSPTRWTRVQANLIRERRREGSIPVGPTGWSRVVRLQFTL